MPAKCESRGTRGWPRVAAALFGLVVAGAHADAEYWDKDESPVVAQTGDMLQIGLPLLALGMTYLLTDSESSSGYRGLDAFGGSTDAWLHLNGSPRHDLALAFARTELAVYGLKYSVDAQRPNGSDHSFPSGHTAASFMGAEFIRKEYGWAWGVPAYLAASYVGWSRVVSGNHWPRDVFAGAAIGILSNYDLDRIQTSFGTIEIKPLIRTAGDVGFGADIGFTDELRPDFLNAFDQTPTLGLQLGFSF
jgi:membrane-associated phospholipid phosphatase